MLWMGALYRLSGFLHWGFNYYIGDDIWHSACCPHKGALLPAGDAHIVYPGKDGRPWRSMRFEAQRAGAEDYELPHAGCGRRPRRGRRTGPHRMHNVPQLCPQAERRWRPRACGCFVCWRRVARNG